MAARVWTSLLGQVNTVGSAGGALVGPLVMTMGLLVVRVDGAVDGLVRRGGRWRPGKNQSQSRDGAHHHEFS
jgi:hypothetical protein